MTVVIQREGKRRTVACMEAVSCSWVKIGLKSWKLYYNLKLKVKSKEKSCIKINIRELDEVLSTNYLPYIH